MKRTGPISNGLYVGCVSHKRLRPVRHELSYHVFSILVDCRTLEDLTRKFKFLSYNRRNIFSLQDRDHGDGTSLREYLDTVAFEAGFEGGELHFFMLCYPRILGYVFNPITVYFGVDDAGVIRLMIYEVNNTFGARQSYVLPVDADATDLISQSCAKKMYVSPFNTKSGTYRFAVTRPAEAVTIGVALHTALGPTMKAHFSGKRQNLTDKNLLRAILRTGWMSVKVMVSIHYEALKLWLKGLPIQRRIAPDNKAAGNRSVAKRSLS